MPEELPLAINSITITSFEVALLVGCPIAASIGGFAHILILHSRYDRIPRPGSYILLPKNEAKFRGAWMLFRLMLSAIIGLLAALYFMGAVKEDVATFGKLLAVSMIIGYSAPRIWAMQEEIVRVKARELAEKLKQSETHQLNTNKTEPNQVLETTIFAATPRAPSSTSRASEDCGSF